MSGTAPIVVLGAHRSGTSALTRVLGDLGVFVGARLDPNAESWFFLRLNEWLLRACGGRWDHPSAVDDLLGDPRLRALAVDYLRLATSSPRVAGYLGLWRTLRTRRLGDLRVPWAFKDPRTTFTWPLWREVFAEARIVHIHRHGVDVAASLAARQVRQAEASARLYRRNRPLLRWLPKRAGFTDSPRCGTPEGALALWEEYVLRARRHVAGLGADALELRFEDLVERPEDVVARLCSWAGIDPSSGARRQAVARLDSGRSLAFRDDPAWRALAERFSDRVERVRSGPLARSAGPTPLDAAPAAPRTTADVVRGR